MRDEVHGMPLNRRIASRRQHDRLAHPGRRLTDRRLPPDNRRVLLVGRDKAWRLLSAFVFEEAGYRVYAAAAERKAVSLTARLLPDVVVVQSERADSLDAWAALSDTPITSDIPVVVITSADQGAEARAYAPEGVTLLPDPHDVDALVGQVDTLVESGPRAQRWLRRRLLKLRRLGRYSARNSEAQALLRHLIDHLQIALLALDEQCRCIAVSRGVTSLTGYARTRLIGASLFDSDFPGGQLSTECWRRFLAHRHYAATTSITSYSGEDVTVHVAAVAGILPGFHAAAFAAT
jgi:PAS domain S-box-containing protein